MTRLLFFAFVAAFAVARAQDVPAGYPFGPIGDADIARLQEFATKGGFDLKAELARVYSPTNKVDEDALGRVFAFSRQFSVLDPNARAYGHLIFCSLLNIGEIIGVPRYAKIIDRQPPDVQQRIRDFLFYPVATRAPKEQWEATLDENRQMYPGLFPKGFQFGHGDPIFTKRPNHAMQPTAGRRTLKISVNPTSTLAATRALASGG